MRKQKRCAYSKSYADLYHHAKESSIKVVLVQQEKKQTLMPKFNTTPYKVIARKGTTVVGESKEQHYITRNVSHFKQIPDVNEMDHSNGEECGEEPEIKHDYRRSRNTKTTSAIWTWTFLLTFGNVYIVYSHCFVLLF